MKALEVEFGDGCSNLQVLLGRLRPGPRAEGDEADGLQIER